MSTLTPAAPSTTTVPPQLTGSQPLVDLRNVLNSELFIIDDEQLVIDTLSHHLRTAGFTSIHGFTNSSEAIDTLRFVRPDVILTDLHMPDVSGSFLTKLIRTFTHLKDVPVMVVTSDHRAETAAAIRRKGADVVLCKPVQPDHLIQCVVETLNRARSKTDAQQQALANQQQKKDRMNRNLQHQYARLRQICRPQES